MGAVKHLVGSIVQTSFSIKWVISGGVRLEQWRLINDTVPYVTKHYSPPKDLYRDQPCHPSIRFA